MADGAVMAWYPKRIFQWIVGGLANAQVGPQGTGGGGLTSEAADIDDTRAMQLSAVWSCVRLISESVSCLPIGFYRRDGEGRAPLEDSHPLVTLFKYSPNPVMTDVEFREAMTTQLVLWGNAYARIDRVGGRPVSLTPLIPGRMEVIRRVNGSVLYQYHTESGTENYEKSDIFHLKGFSAEGIVGFSPLAIARQSMGLAVAAEQYSAGSFRRGGRPAGTLNFDKILTPEQRTAAREIHESITNGALNSTKNWVLEGGVTYNPISIPPDDMQMLESRQFQLGEIARFFRVPSHLINDSEKATSWGSGLEQLDLGFLKYTLTPYLRRWETTIRDSLMTPLERRRLVIEHNVEGMLRADSKARAEFYASMAQNGLMTRNEIRKKENLPAVAGGDELTVQVNLAPLDTLESAVGVSDEN